MRHLPAFHDVHDRIVAVIGRTAEADAKAALARAAGAIVRQADAAEASVFDDAAMVFIATGDALRDAALAAEARARGLPVNVVDRPGLGTFIMGSVIDRDPVTIAVSTGGAAPMLAQHIRRRIETVIPATFGRLAVLLGRARARIRAAAPDAAARRGLYRRLLDGDVAQLALGGRGEAAEAALARELAAAPLVRVGRAPGRVYLVGAGPGDPDLLTVKALRLLGEADVIVYDRLVSDEVMDRARRDAIRIPAGKAPGNHTLTQGEINNLLVRLAREGKSVVRLKGGDPFVFGRGGEEAEALAGAGIPFEVVPGITAALGCAAYAGIPLTHRDHAQSCLLVTGHTKAGRLDVDWDALTRPHQTVAVYMGIATLPALQAGLLARGVPATTPCAIVVRGSRPDQEVLTMCLADLVATAAGARMDGPALVVIGKVAALAGSLHWFGAAPQTFLSAAPRQAAG